MRRRIREGVIGRELGITQSSWRRLKEKGLTPDPVGRGWAGGTGCGMTDMYDLYELREWIKTASGVIRYDHKLGRKL